MKYVPFEIFKLIYFQIGSIPNAFIAKLALTLLFNKYQLK